MNKCGRNKMLKVLHQSFRSLSAYIGLEPHLIQKHSKLRLVEVLRKKKSPIVFKSILQETLGLPVKELTIHQPEVKLYKLKDTWLAGPSGFIYPDPNHLLSLDNATCPASLRKVSRPLKLLASKVDEPIFHLAGNSNSRAHHVMQHLSRYQIAALALPAEVRPLIYNGQKHWQADYLAVAGCSRSALETSMGSLYCRDIYYVPVASGPGIQLTGEPHHYLDLRERALHGRTLQRRPVFLSRQDAPDRRLINEDSIYRVAQSLIPDIERVSLSGLNFKQQIERVAGAPILISPHGQGTHLTLFCEKTISIQLTPGVSELHNKFYECALLFDFFASIGNQNQTITLASEMPHTSALNDWSYPEKRFNRELSMVLQNSEFAAKNE
jgi:hypothetical protein